MKLIYFKDSEANLIRGVYKSNHELQPVIYGKDFNLLNKEAIDRIQNDLNTSLKLKINDKTTFIIDDGSKEAIQYQTYLHNQNLE